MASRNYSDGLAGAAVAAGGTLGVLIPPSILLVIYALMTEQSIGASFAGAMMPGILPFIAADAVRVVMILALPALVLWLPNWLGLG